MKRKVKRYDQIYNRRRNRREKLMKILITILILLVIVALTFFVAAGIFNMKNSGSQEEISSSQVESSSESSEQNESVKVEADKIIAIQMPVKNLQDTEGIKAFAKSAKEDGYNTVVVSLKGSNGELMYQSDLEEATRWNTMAKNPVDAKEIAGLIQDAGLMPMAQISAFEDSLAGNVQFDNTYTKKNGTIWADSKGLSWLNPYKESARAYICHIVQELGNFGYQRILVEGAQFPKNLGSAVTSSNKITQKQILEQFYQELTNTGTPFTVSYQWDTITGGTSKGLYGGDPTSYTGSEVLSPIINLSSYPSGYKSGANTYKQADDLTAFIFGLAQKNAQQGVILLPEIASSQNIKLIQEGLASLGIYNFIVLSK